MKICLFALILAGLSCSKEDKNSEDEPRYTAHTSVPATFRLKDGALPVDTCIPVQTYITESAQAKSPVALGSDMKVTLQERAPGNDEAELKFYRTRDCKEEFKDSIVVPASTNGVPAFANFSMRAGKVGNAKRSFCTEGSSWHVCTFETFEFTHQTK